MFKSFLVLIAAILFASCTSTFYVVRHAEKESASSNMMSSDVPLSAVGKERAIALSENLRGKKIIKIYSTNYLRTRSTAEPLSKDTGVPITIYDPRDSSFVPSIRAIKGNVLIVGHSNTVDDIVNGLVGWKAYSDLPETQYGDIFVVRRSGRNWTVEQTKLLRVNP